MHLKFVAIAVGLAWLAGVSVGAWAVYEIWSVANLQADLHKMREDQERMKKVLSINRETDDTSAAIERENQVIIDRIVRLVEASKQPAIAKGSKDGKDSASEFVCVDSDSMRSIGQLR